jgi:hypothetical protein
MTDAEKLALRSRIEEAGRLAVEALNAGGHSVVIPCVANGRPVKKLQPIVDMTPPKIAVPRVWLQSGRVLPAGGVLLGAAARRTPAGRSAPAGRSSAARGHTRRDDPGREPGSGGDDDPPHHVDKFELHPCLNTSQPMNGHREWKGSEILYVLALEESRAVRDLRVREADRAAREALERKEAESHLQDAERKPCCSRCGRKVDPDDVARNGRRGRRSWCKPCDVQLRKGYPRSRAVTA